MEGPINQTPQQTQQPDMNPVQMLERHIQTGSNWFYWIAALSLVNTISAQLHASWQFLIGTAFTQALDEFAADPKMARIKVILLGVNLFVIAIYAMIGYFSSKKQNWAFITGIVIYGLDALLMIGVIIIFREAAGTFAIPIAIHAWALWRIVNGLKANLALPKATYQAAYQQPEPPAGF